MSGGSSNASQTRQTTSNTQLGFENIDGIAVGSGDVTIVDGNAIASNTAIAHDALATSRSGFTFALDALDNVGEFLADAQVRDNAADAQAIQTLVSATRSDSAATLSTISRTAGIALVGLASFVLFLTLKRK